MESNKLLNQEMNIYFQGLIVLWMTRTLTEDIPGWGILFHNEVGDGTVTVSSYDDHKTVEFIR
jgi:hypothetical protein